MKINTLSDIKEKLLDNEVDPTCIITGPNGEDVSIELKDKTLKVHVHFKYDQSERAWWA